MKDFAIIYSSKTGNTRKVAEALWAAAPERCDIFQAESAPALDNYKVLFLGYWVDKGSPNAKMKELLLGLDNKNIVFFQTLGAEPKSNHAMACFANAGKLVQPSCRIMGALSIRGAIDPQLIAAMQKLPQGHPHAPSAESRARWEAAAPHPDAADLEEAKQFMLQTISMFDRFYKA